VLAAHTFEEAAANASTDEDRINYLSRASWQHARAGAMGRALEIADNLRKRTEGNSDLQSRVLNALQTLAEIEKNDELQVAVLEERAELRPEDISVRFTLAFKHSEIGNSDMALHHYLKIPVGQRDPTTWNNLGVSFGAFEMSAKAVAAWRRSESQNQTLAMSNLGFRLLNAGFLDEAQAECDKAMKIDDYHQNILELLKQLRNVPKEEDRNLREALEKMRPKVAFYRKLGAAVLKRTPTDMAPKWNSIEGVLDATIDGTAIRIHGSHESPTLAGLLVGGPQKMVLHKVTYIGQLYGSAIIGTVTRSREGEGSSIIGDTPTEKKFLMYFEIGGGELSVMEEPGAPVPTFLSLKRVA
jgi:tetratricopeptide (TPR) repeat protein